ncbi:hypothetical protein Dimus_019802 [Dionaea muscipula]
MATRRAPATSRLSLLAGCARYPPSSCFAGRRSCSLFERKVFSMSTSRKLELLAIISRCSLGVVVRRNHGLVPVAEDAMAVLEAEHRSPGSVELSPSVDGDVAEGSSSVHVSSSEVAMLFLILR